MAAGRGRLQRLTRGARALERGGRQQRSRIPANALSRQAAVERALEDGLDAPKVSSRVDERCAGNVCAASQFRCAGGETRNVGAVETEAHLRLRESLDCSAPGTT